MNDGYIKVQYLLDFCANQRDHSISPNDIMRIPYVAWISVKDRLPEEDTDVLVWNRLGIEIAAYTTNPVKRWYSYNGQEVIAIYWMPLPEPPKEG